MHRNRTWQIDPEELRTQRNRILPIEGGDGSTLSLDFTTGVLDPRLVFTRSTNATFINSQGYVQYAAANMIRNSVFSGTSTPTAWTLNAGGAGATIPSSGVRRCVTTASAQNFLNSATFSTAIGVVYATTVNIREVSGQHYRNAFEITASPTILKYYKNGIEINSGSGEFITAEAGLITVVWIATSATAHNLRLGVGATGSNVANAVCEFELPHTTPVFFSGTTTANSPSTYTAPAYVPNTDTSAAYHAPRFDYDPTTLTARGLLIEGSAVNYVLQSAVNTFPSPWSTAGTNLPTPTAAYTGGGFAPDNISRPTRIQFGLNAGGSASRILQATAYTTNPTTAAPYTVSVWMKSNTPGTSYSINIYKATGNNLVTVTDSWQRFTVVNTSGTSLVGYIYISNESASVAADILIWGVQLEAGNGASSYIPTGTGQGSRAVDICTMSNIAELNYNANGGTLFAHFSNNTENANFAGSIAFNNSGNYAQRFRWGSGLLLASYFQTNGTSVLGSNLNGSRTSFASAKAATSYSFDGTTTSTAMSINGAQATTTPTSSATAGVSIATALALNSDNSSAGTNYPSIAIRSIKFWPTGLTMAQMNALTVNP